jgi:hypothetical protein
MLRWIVRVSDDGYYRMGARSKIQTSPDHPLLLQELFSAHSQLARRLQLREMTINDLNDLHRVFSDSIAMQNYPKAFDLEITTRWIASRGYDMNEE